MNITKNNPPKNYDDDLLIKALSKGENSNKNESPLSQSDMALITSVLNNRSFMTIMKILSKDPSMKEHLNNFPEIKALKDNNPIFNEALNNPDLMNKLTSPEFLDTFSQMTSVLNKKNNKENKNYNNINNIFDNNINNKINLVNNNKEVEIEDINVPKKI